MASIDEKGETKTATIATILAAASSGYSLDIFTAEEVAALELILKRANPYRRCHVTAKERPANPEEIVRQLYLCKLIHADDYPKDRIAVEKGAFWGQAKMIIADRWDESVSTSAGKKVITHVLVRGFSADLAPRGATRAARPQKWRSR